MAHGTPTKYGGPTGEVLAALVGWIGHELERELDAARAELEELALGIQPQTLTAEAFAVAIHDLAARSPIPVEVVVSALTPVGFALAGAAATVFAPAQPIAVGGTLGLLVWLMPLTCAACALRRERRRRL
jgi:hypothetical protein